MQNIFRNRRRAARQSFRRQAAQSFLAEPLEARQLLSVGSLDATFGARGVGTYPTLTSASDLQIEPNQSILAMSGGAIVHFSPLGVLDTSFGSGGQITTGLSLAQNGYAFDGKFIVAGQGRKNTIAVERYNVNGTLDTSFGSRGLASFPASSGQSIVFSSAAVQSDGSVLVLFDQQASGGSTTNATTSVVQFSASGALDSSFGTDGVASVGGVRFATGLSISPAGDILVQTNAGATGSSGSAFVDVFNSAGAAEGELASFASGSANFTLSPPVFVTGDEVLLTSTMQSRSGASTSVIRYNLATLQADPSAGPPVSLGDTDGTAQLALAPDGTALAAYQPSGSPLAFEDLTDADVVNTSWGLNGTALPTPPRGRIVFSTTPCFQGNGDYILAGQKSGALVLARFVESATSAPAAPTASAGRLSASADGRTLKLRVTYSSASAINTRSLTGANVQVDGPTDSALFAADALAGSRASVSSSSNGGEQVVVTYQFNLPPADGSGAYTFWLASGAPTDSSGAGANGGLLERFNLGFTHRGVTIQAVALP